MEWVSTTAKSVPEAIDLALDNLGVDQAEAEIVVVEEPKQGLFGRVRGSARVKARVKPLENTPEPSKGRRRNEKRRSNNKSKGRRNGSGRSSKGSKTSESDRKERSESEDKEKSSSSDRRDSNGRGGRNQRGRGGRGGRGPRQNRSERDVPDSSKEEVSEHLQSFLSGLSTSFGLDGKVRIDEDAENSIVATIEGQHGLLVGPKGRTLEAIQELSRMSAQRTVPSSVRIAVDVGGYRLRRNEALEAFALKAADRAIKDDTEVALEPMSSSDRKAIHNALIDVSGVETRSSGNDPRRRVVVVPVGVSGDSDEQE